METAAAARARRSCWPAPDLGYRVSDHHAHPLQRPLRRIEQRLHPYAEHERQQEPRRRWHVGVRRDAVGLLVAGERGLDLGPSRGGTVALLGGGLGVGGREAAEGG